MRQAGVGVESSGRRVIPIAGLIADVDRIVIHRPVRQTGVHDADRRAGGRRGVVVDGNRGRVGVPGRVSAGPALDEHLGQIRRGGIDPRERRLRESAVRRVKRRHLRRGEIVQRRGGCLSGVGALRRAVERAQDVVVRRAVRQPRVGHAIRRVVGKGPNQRVRPAAGRASIQALGRHVRGDGHRPSQIDGSALIRGVVGRGHGRRCGGRQIVDRRGRDLGRARTLVPRHIHRRHPIKVGRPVHQSRIGERRGGERGQRDPRIRPAAGQRAVHVIAREVGVGIGRPREVDDAALIAGTIRGGDPGRDGGRRRVGRRRRRAGIGVQARRYGVVPVPRQIAAVHRVVVRNAGGEPGVHRRDARADAGRRGVVHRHRHRVEVAGGIAARLALDQYLAQIYDRGVRPREGRPHGLVVGRGEIDDLRRRRVIRGNRRGLVRIRALLDAVERANHVVIRRTVGQARIRVTRRRVVGECRNQRIRPTRRRAPVHALHGRVSGHGRRPTQVDRATLIRGAVDRSHARGRGGCKIVDRDPHGLERITTLVRPVERPDHVVVGRAAGQPLVGVRRD